MIKFNLNYYTVSIDSIQVVEMICTSDRSNNGL